MDQVQKILVLVDLQNDFVEGSLGTKEAMEATDRTVQKLKDFEGIIYATLDTHYQDYLQTAEGRKLPVVHCVRKSYGWRLHEKIINALMGRKYRTVEKETFGSTKLVDEIAKWKEKGEIEIELIGLCTDICVITNALLLKASFPEVKISVDAGCCAGVTPELHEAALKVMSSCQIDIIRE